jgi:predicted kinase
MGETLRDSGAELAPAARFLQASTPAPMRQGRWFSREELAEGIALARPAVIRPAKRAFHPALIILCGLPGSGKSTLAARIAEVFPVAIVRTDTVRKAIFPCPQYTEDEGRLTYLVAHRLARELLDESYATVLDGTNLTEYSRRQAYAVAYWAAARYLVVRTTAPLVVLQSRLEHAPGGAGRYDSDATWLVALRMRRNEEPVAVPHLEVDTSLPIAPAVRAIVAFLRGYCVPLPSPGVHWQAAHSLALPLHGAVPGFSQGKLNVDEKGAKG